MKIPLQLLWAFVLVSCAPVAQAGIRVQYFAGYGLYPAGSPDTASTAPGTGLLAANGSHRALVQLISAGPNHANDGLDLDDPAGGYTGGDDVVLDSRILEAGVDGVDEWGYTAALPPPFASTNSPALPLFVRVHQEDAPSIHSYWIHDTPLVWPDDLSSAVPNPPADVKATVIHIETGSETVPAAGLAVGTMVGTNHNWYVATNGSDAAVGTSWTTAKRTIQAAVDVAAANDTVWVSNGVYATGGRVANGTWTNRVVIDKPIRVQSANGRAATTIQGMTGIRCAYVGTNAVLSGFTLDGGRARTDGSDPDGFGGGAWCEPSGVVSDSKLSWNQASYGGGAYGGTLNDCHFYVNTAWSEGGGSYGSVLNDCTLEYNAAEDLENDGGGGGGGAAASTLNDCTLVGNTAILGAGSYYSTLNRCALWGNTAFHGGGAYGGTLNDCLLKGNSSSYGGGARSSTLNNCTLSGNSATGDGGGALQCTVNNSIVFGNTAGNGSNHLDSSFQYSCTAPDPGGSNNVVADPQFVDSGAGDYRLASESPCINAGNNAYVAGTNDLDGNLRIVNVAADMGAYEDQRYLDWYVATNGNDMAAGTNWATAKRTIQAALDGANAGDAVWVGPGTYQERLTLSNSLTLASTEGPHVTTILGTGEGRCITMTNCNAVVSGFTITGGRNEWGAGVHMPAGSRIESCIVSNNGIYIETSEGGSGRGGGIYGGQARNCLITGNFLHISGGSKTSDAYAGGGGAFFCTLENCTVVGNWTYAYAYVAASEGGGGLACTFINTIVWSNPAYLSFLPGVYTDGDTFDHSYTNDPGFADSTYRLQAGSPCLDIGVNLDWLAAATDLDGNPRVVHGCVDLGAYERQALMISPLGTNVAPAAASGLTFAVAAEVAWTAATNVPWLTITSGASGSTNGTVTFDVAANETYCGRTGTISVTDGGVIWTYAVAQAAHEHVDWYVATNGNDAADGTSWATAKQTIQAAVDEAANGHAIWVGNGTYVGEIRIAKELRVQSANGADFTTIQGASSRCVTLSNALAVVSGFTLTGGTADWGGGAYIVSGTLEDCVIRNNSATGRESGDLEMAYGGGTYGGTLRRCILSNNLARADGDQYHRPKAQGGGAYDSELVDCLVVSNVARSRFAWLSEDVTAGGGASGGTLVNCTLVGNVACVDYAPASGALTGAGCHGSAARNSIVYGNYCYGVWDEIIGAWMGVSWDEISGGDVRYSCSPFLSTDNGNRTNVPQFVDAEAGDYRLAAGSPCIDAGDNAFVIGTTDLDGRPRIVNGTVDMGAFECPPVLEISPTSTNLSHEAASGLSFEVRTRVPWTATTNVPWLTITAGASGTTNGTVVFDVAANEGTALRAGTIEVTGGGSVCSYAVMQTHEGQSTNGYYTWAAGITNGLTNATDCAAGDGVPNLLRYAAGCPDPMMPDDLAALQIGIGIHPGLIFNRNPDAADLAWFVESADRMADDAAWRGVATNVGGSWLGATNVQESGTGNPVECTVTDPVALDSNRFLRLRVSRP